MNARQSVAQGRSSSEYRDARSTERETGLGYKLTVLSQPRSAKRGHRHPSHVSPTEIHMKVDAAVAFQTFDIDSVSSPDRCSSGGFQLR